MKKLKVGDKAPLFEGIDQNGNLVKLSDFKGKNIILFFYPKASTPGCTAEASDLQNNYEYFLKKDFKIIGISADSVKRQLNFAIKNNLKYSLIADEEKKIINMYGVWGLKKFMGKEYEGLLRTTFIIDEHGKVKAVIDKVKTKEHARQIIEILNI